MDQYLKVGTKDITLVTMIAINFSYGNYEHQLKI